MPHSLVKPLKESSSEEDDNPILHQKPQLKNFYKHFGVYFPEKWMEIGVLLGVPKLKLQSLEASKIDDAKATMDIFDLWEKTNEVEFSWKSLFKELNSSSIDKNSIAQIKQKVIEELSQS